MAWIFIVAAAVIIFLAGAAGVAVSIAGSYQTD